MTRQRLHLLIDGFLFAGAWALLTTGFLMAWVLPPGRGGDAVWGLSRHAWGEVHFWSAVFVTGVLLVHLALNWGWVCSVTAKLLGGKAGRRSRVVSGVATVALVVIVTAALLLLANATKVTGTGGGQGHRWHSAAW